MLLTNYVATMTTILSLLAQLQPDPDMALQAFPHHMSTIYENVLPVYPIIAPADLHNLVYSIVHEPTEESFTVASQDFDIGFTAVVLRLGHRLFEQTLAADQLRFEGNTNIDQFEPCKWQRFAESNQAPTLLPWFIEGMSFNFLYQLSVGCPTGRIQAVMLSVCEKQARTPESREWNERVKLTGAWLMLFETLPLSPTRFPLPESSISFLSSLDTDELLQWLLPRMVSDLASNYVRRVQSCLVQHMIWQSPKSRQSLEISLSFTTQGFGSILDIVAYYPWYSAYIELAREQLLGDAQTKHYAQAFLQEVINHLKHLQKDKNIFHRTLSLQREIEFVRTVAQGAKVRLCELDSALLAHQELLRFMEVYMEGYIGKGQMREHRADSSSLRRPICRFPERLNIVYY